MAESRQLCSYVYSAFYIIWCAVLTVDLIVGAGGKYVAIIFGHS